MSNDTHRKISQPADWWRAFEAAASAAGLTLAEWLGEAARRRLPPEVRQQLSRRRKPGRPKATQ